MYRLLLILALLVTPAVVAGQASTDSLPTYSTSASAPKRVAVARVLAIVPGVGHGYAGEGGRGLGVVGGLLGIAGVTGVIGAAICVGDVLNGSIKSACEDNPVAVLGGLAFSGAWVSSIYDAGAAARRTNTRAARVAQRKYVPFTLGLTRRPTATGHDARAIKVGLRFKVRRPNCAPRRKRAASWWAALFGNPSSGFRRGPRRYGDARPEDPVRPREGVTGYSSSDHRCSCCALTPAPPQTMTSADS